MDKYYVYILYSPELDSYYIGQTLNPEVRLNQHLKHSMENAHTKRSDDWALYYQIECESRQQAILIERHIKRMKSKKYIENLKKYQEISRNLLGTYK